MTQHPLPFDPGADEWLQQIAEQYQQAMNGDAGAFSIIAGYAQNDAYWEHWLAQPNGAMGPSNTHDVIRNARAAYQAAHHALQNRGATVVGGVGEPMALVLTQPEIRAPGDGSLVLDTFDMPVLKIDGVIGQRPDATTGQGLDESGVPGNNGVGGDGVVAGRPAKPPTPAANGNGQTWLWLLGGLVLVVVALKLFRAS